MAAKKILFVNTFEPVVPLYRDVFPKLEIAGIQPIAIVSACQYRLEEWQLAVKNLKQVWVPRPCRKNRRLCALFYYFACPFVLAAASSDTRIVFLSQPPLFYILGSAIARLKGNRYYLHVMDLYPDLFEKSGWLAGNFLSKWIKKASATAFSGAEKVITIGRCMKGIVCERGAAIEDVMVVENWPDRMLEQQAGNGSSFRKEYELEGKLVVMYAGNMGQFHLFDTILSVANRLRNRKDIVFVFIGRGSRRPELEAAVRDGADNIVLLDHQTAADFAGMLAAGDVHFVSLRKEFSGLVVPSKFYGILAVGRPVVYEGAADGEVARVINEEQCGAVAETGDDRQLETILTRYLEDRTRVVEDGRNARVAYERRFRGSELAQRYADLITG